MKKIFELLLRLFSGFFTCALGIVFMLNSNLGAGPWDVFHQGLSNNTFLTIGQASIIVGFIVIGTTTLFKLKIGVGTILNMIFIGLFTDLVLFTKLVPISDNILSGLIMIIIGMLLMSLGTYLYISCELGCGPRDGLMVVLTKITKKPVSTIRGIIEIGALIAGYLLGGHVGIGRKLEQHGFQSRIVEFPVSVEYIGSGVSVGNGADEVVEAFGFVDVHHIALHRQWRGVDYGRAVLSPMIFEYV